MSTYRDNPFSYWMVGPSLDEWSRQMGIPLTDDYPQFCWVDIETTGLNPKKEVILELGMTFTNGIGEICRHHGTIDWLVFDTDPWTRRVHEDAMNSLDPFVHEMHTKSGLLRDLEKARAHPLNHLLAPDSVCDSAVNWLHDQLGNEVKNLQISGSSAHFDRGFLAAHMYSLEQQFHYRVGVDVSGLREVFKRTNPSVVERQPEKMERHRPIPDLADSIRLFRHMLRTGMILDGGLRERLG